MKTILTNILILAFSFLLQNANAQYNSSQVLASNQGYNYTEAHFQKVLKFVEFVIGAKINAAEVAEGKKASLAEFMENPVSSLQQIQNIDTQMQRIYQLTNPYHIAIARSAFLSQFYAMSQQMQEEPFMFKMMKKYAPVLAIDLQNLLAFTEQDFQGYLTILKLNSQATGINYNYSNSEIQQCRQALIQQFNTANANVRQSMCVMSVLAKYMTAAYNKMSYAQKQKLQNDIMNQQAYQYQYQNNYNTGANDPFMQGYNSAPNIANSEVQWPAGVNTKSQKQAYLRQMRSKMNANSATMGIMNDMMMNTHATMLNTVENFGNTGNYWQVTNGY